MMRPSSVLYISERGSKLKDPINETLSSITEDFACRDKKGAVCKYGVILLIPDVEGFYLALTKNFFILKLLPL